MMDSEDTQQTISQTLVNLNEPSSKPKPPPTGTDQNGRETGIPPVILRDKMRWEGVVRALQVNKINFVKA